MRTTPVYREVIARDERRGADVKLWLVGEAMLDDPSVASRFVGAVRSWLDAPVPGGMRLSGGGVVAGTAYVRVPVGKVECLRTRLLHWRPSVDDVTRIVGTIVETITAAHERCWLHGLFTARDVLFHDKGVVIGGIGLWQTLARRPMLAALWHEAHCLAPEVRAGETIGVGADLYSVAGVAAELLQAATGATTTALRRRGWHPMLIEAVDRLLANGQVERPSSLAGLATALQVRAGAPAAAAPVKTPAPEAPPSTPVPVAAVGSSPFPRITPAPQAAPAPRVLAPHAPPRPMPPPQLLTIAESADSDVPTLRRRSMRRLVPVHATPEPVTSTSTPAPTPAPRVRAHPRIMRRR